jgi:hypothetical protein
MPPRFALEALIVPLNSSLRGTFDPANFWISPATLRTPVFVSLFLSVK